MIHPIKGPTCKIRHLSLKTQKPVYKVMSSGPA